MRYTVPENECEAFAVLWSKTAIFRGAWQNVDMQQHPWVSTALIPHIRAFKAPTLPALVLKIMKGHYQPLPSHYSKELKGMFRLKINITSSEFFIYSSRKWMLVVFCFMKQNCYFQRGVAECRHAATPLTSYRINTTHQGFQKRYITLLYLKGLKSYQQKYKWKVRFTK